MPKEIRKLTAREQLAQRYHDCKSQAEKDAMYWATPELQEMYSAANHGPEPESSPSPSPRSANPS